LVSVKPDRARLSATMTSMGTGLPGPAGGPDPKNATGGRAGRGVRRWPAKTLRRAKRRNR
jgi:hypothetical protein